MEPFGPEQEPMREDAMTRNVGRWLAALITLGATLGVAWQSPAAADTVRLVTPFAAGGPADLLARLLAQELREQLGADVVVDNRGGAGGVLGTEAVARAAPDGKTLLLGSLGSHVISAALRAQLSYDPRKSFDPLVLIGSVPSVLVVGPQLEAASLGQLIALAKQGRKLSYGSPRPRPPTENSGGVLAPR